MFQPRSGRVMLISSFPPLLVVIDNLDLVNTAVFPTEAASLEDIQHQIQNKPHPKDHESDNTQPNEDELAVVRSWRRSSYAHDPVNLPEDVCEETDHSDPSFKLSTAFGSERWVFGRPPA